MVIAVSLVTDFRFGVSPENYPDPVNTPMQNGFLFRDILIVLKQYTVNHETLF